MPHPALMVATFLLACLWLLSDVLSRNGRIP